VNPEQLASLIDEVSADLENRTPDSMRLLKRILKGTATPDQVIGHFRTPARPPKNAVQPPIFERAEKIQIMDQGDAITLHRFRSPLSIERFVLFVHGWGGRAWNFEGFVSKFLEKRYGVIAVDLPAHGESEGSFCDGLRSAKLIQNICSEIGPFEGAVAHSFGSAAVNLAIFDGSPLGRLVHIAPFVNIPHRAIEFAMCLGLEGDALAEFWKLCDQNWGVQRMINSSGHVLAPYMSNSMLTIWDEGDSEIPERHVKSLVSSWPEAQLHTTQGLGHVKILTDEKVQMITSVFITGN